MNPDTIATSEELIIAIWDGLEAGFVRHPVIRTGERDPNDPAVRAAVLERDRYRCQWCHAKRDLQLDHIVPWSAGGPDTIDNLRVLCGPCNATRSNYVADAELIELRDNARRREVEIRRESNRQDEEDGA